MHSRPPPGLFEAPPLQFRPMSLPRHQANDESSSYCGRYSSNSISPGSSLFNSLPPRNACTKVRAFCFFFFFYFSFYIILFTLEMYVFLYIRFFLASFFFFFVILFTPERHVPWYVRFVSCFFSFFFFFSIVFTRFFFYFFLFFFFIKNFPKCMYFRHALLTFETTH